MLLLYKTVKCEVINVKFLSRGIPLNNSANMVKWKCVKFLYLSKVMCRQSIEQKWYIKNIKFLKQLIPFSLYSAGILVLRN